TKVSRKGATRSLTAGAALDCLNLSCRVSHSPLFSSLREELRKRYSLRVRGAQQKNRGESCAPPAAALVHFAYCFFLLCSHRSPLRTLNTKTPRPKCSSPLSFAASLSRAL